MLVPIGSVCDVARIIISREDLWQLILERKNGENAFLFTSFTLTGVSNLETISCTYGTNI